MTKDKRPDWFSLEPGEQLLWERRPREGAGWRCILNDGWTPVLTLLALIGGGGVLALVAAGRDVPGVLIGFAVMMLTAPLLGYWSGRDLASTRYAVTDRRSLSVELVSRQLLTIEHRKARLNRRMTPCGAVIEVGYGKKFVWRGPLNWKPAEDEQAPLTFLALDPDTAPFDLLARLTAEHRPPRVDDLPWQPGFTR